MLVFFFSNFCDSHSCTQALCVLGILDMIFFSGGAGGIEYYNHISSDFFLS